MVYENLRLAELKKKIKEEKKAVQEMASLLNALKKKGGFENKTIVDSHINSLKNHLKKTNDEVLALVEKISIAKPLGLESKREPVKVHKSFEQKEPQKTSFKKTSAPMKKGLTDLEIEAIKRLKKKKTKISKIKIKKPNKYVIISSKMFGDFSSKLLSRGRFPDLKKDLTKANLQFTPVSYLSVTFFTTFLSIIFGVLIFIFFMLFNIGAELPIITKASEELGSRFLKVFWIVFVVPIGTFFAMYVYPSLEKRSAEQKINQELPFVTIHLAAISGSMIEPSRIFEIIMSTGEYQHTGKEFTKLINEINVYGCDLVTALKNTASNNPSKKLAELLNGLATTINSGGSLPEFFDKRAQSLLFEHRLEREKYTKTAETFMDIYISVVIAAPMIFMLLLMMIKISGLGLSLSTTMISLSMILGVAMVNVIFLTLLHLKQPKE